MDKNITFDQLPEFVYGIMSKVDTIEELIVKLLNQDYNQNRWLSIEELIDYIPIKYSVSTIRRKVQNNSIPHYGSGKNVRFLQKDIDCWLQTTDNKVNDKRQDFVDKNILTSTEKWKLRHGKNKYMRN